MQTGRCDWCQEYGGLTQVVNRDVTASHGFDWVCAACAEVERFEHVDELLWNPVLLHSTRKHVISSASLDMKLAS
jgi:hypothetical protein